IPLCASWFLPNDPEKRTGHQVFRESRIPTARFFDLDAVKDHDSPYPHMLPTAEDFAKAMRNLGIRRDDEIVIYDSKELGIFSAPRVGWTFRVFGHPSVHILNNYRLWVERGFPTESDEAPAVENEQQSDYPVPSVNPEMVVKFAEVKDIAKDYGKEGAEGIQILDARPRGRWAGTAPEPRQGLSSGHIPGSISVPHSELLDPETGALLAGEELKKVFEGKGVDPGKPVISSCGTGVTAAVIDTALGEAGWGKADDRRLYDGSWTEWAQRVKQGDGLIRKEE
ncbi:thiosulfate/3-mercaptopyruvate sulfurtransferase, partial [Lecanoromycetidae sp. Uapishka_2]